MNNIPNVSSLDSSSEYRKILQLIEVEEEGNAIPEGSGGKIKKKRGLKHGSKKEGKINVQ